MKARVSPLREYRLNEKRLNILVVAASGAPDYLRALRAELPVQRVDLFASPSAALERLERLALSTQEGPLYDVALLDASAVALVEQLVSILPRSPILVLCEPERLEQLRATLVDVDAVVPAAPGVEIYLPEIVRLHVERRRLATDVYTQRLEIEELGARDVLTGLANLRRFEETLAVEIERARRFHRPLTLCRVDVDALEEVNETYGRAAGDAVLRHVGGRLRGQTRRFEVAARLRGDDFLMMLIDTSFEAGRQVAERLVRAISESPVGVVGSVRVSVGLATFPLHARNADDLVGSAERALSEAKGGGFNRVAVSRAIRRERIGERHKIRIKLLVKARDVNGSAFTEQVETESISRRGARVTCSRAVPVGSRLELQSPYHTRALEAEVTGCYRGSDGRHRVGFKLVAPPRWSA